MARRLDAQTAFEIVSIDIGEVSVGENIGARLQADQAEADMRVARANAEGRRAMAVAEEQEMIAAIEENRAKVVQAEAEVPKAIAQGLPRGQSGHHGLLQTAERAGRHRHAQRDFQAGRYADRETRGRGMNGFWLPPLADANFIELVVVIAIIIIGAINKLTSMTRQGIPPAVPPPDRKLQEDIDRFLKRAANQNPQPKPAGTPVLAQAVPELTEDADEPVGTEVVKHVEKYLDTGVFASRERQLGSEVAQADAQIDQRLKRTFDHEVSRLANKPGEAAAPPAALMTDESAPVAAVVVSLGLSTLLGDPDSIRQAIIVSEVLRGPRNAGRKNPSVGQFSFGNLLLEKQATFAGIMGITKARKHETGESLPQGIRTIFASPLRSSASSAVNLFFSCFRDPLCFFCGVIRFIFSWSIFRSCKFFRAKPVSVGSASV